MRKRINAREWICLIQASTCVAMGILFWHPGTYRLAVAQFLFAITTALVYLR